MNKPVVIKTFHGGCPHDCPDTCSMVYTVQDDKLISVTGNANHPMTRGGLCVKLKDYEKRHYHPDRLLHPLKRTGPKGSKQFKRISWDEALDEITSKWKAIIDEHGPRAIMPNSYLGNQGLVHGLNGADAFLIVWELRSLNVPFAVKVPVLHGYLRWVLPRVSIRKVLSILNTL